MNKKIKKIIGTDLKPRLSVFRSNKHIYAQLINDLTGHTLLSMSSLDYKIKSDSFEKIPSEIAVMVGKKLAERALNKGIKYIVFDRNKYPYKGRIKSLAEGARMSINLNENIFDLNKLIF